MIYPLTGDSRLFTREIRKVRPSGMALATGGNLDAAQKQLPSSLPQPHAQLVEHHHCSLSLYLLLYLPVSFRLVRAVNRLLRGHERVLSLFCIQCDIPRRFSRSTPRGISKRSPVKIEARASSRARARARARLARTLVIERSDDRRTADRRASIVTRTSGNWFLIDLRRRTSRTQA